MKQAMDVRQRLALSGSAVTDSYFYTHSFFPGRYHTSRCARHFQMKTFSFQVEGCFVVNKYCVDSINNEKTKVTIKRWDE